jgi:site-specific recombinase XerD
MNQLWTLLDAQIARRKLQGASRLALEGYRTPVRQFLRWLEQTKQITIPAQLQPDHIEQWMLALRNRRTREGLSLKLMTIIGKRSAVKAFCRQLIREGRISRLMLDAFPSIRQP